MLQEQTRKILDCIGLEDTVLSVFNNSPIGLRFEIGTGEVYDERGESLQAYIDTACDRAYTLYKQGAPGADILLWEVFPKDGADEQVLLDKFVSRFHCSGPQERISKKVKADDTLINRAGFYWDLRHTPIEIKLLLREIAKGDIGGMKELISAVFLFDSRANLLYHYYDDRGLDIVAAHKEVLLPLYQNFADWILEYDRKKIDQVFCQ